ncbi:MAG: bifunctional (p)ppGpp synthetase/guanosine-3',5'-bis(diphosphate) 3'-pyrophosphohydrolase, partial [Cohnella sp.]|nr:bifunctional (p)ppGpp synthetase/guanosine-3',5'-bis(diphosphate) 3'-pyrophosphohydrolase [Cohnella sp.]
MGMEQLLDKASTYMKEQDLLRVRDAYEYADEAHRGQLRKSGEPYILHPVAVAEICMGMQMDVVTVMAALLHDVVEDTNVTVDDLRERFGDTIAGLVDGVTKLER